MNPIRISGNAASFLLTEFFEDFNETDFSWLSPEEVEELKIFVRNTRVSSGQLQVSLPSSPKQGYRIWRFLLDALNDIDDALHGRGQVISGPEEKRFLRGAMSGLDRAIGKVSSHYGSDPEFRPNVNRGSEARQERRHRFLSEVEAVAPEYMPLALKMEWKLPKDTKDESRFERFIQFAQSDEGENMNSILAIERDEEEGKRLGKKQREYYEKLLSELSPEDHALLEEISNWSEPEEQVGDYQFHPRFEDYLSSGELKMLEKIVQREMAESDGHIERTLKAFYVRPPRKNRRVLQ